MANAEAAISQGALQAIYNGEEVENPVFQCVHLKSMAGANSNIERYRLVWSDVRNYIQSMLATQLNYLVNDGKFKKGCFVRLKQYQSQEVKGKKIIIVLDCDILEEYGELEKIGQPVALDGAGVKEEEQEQKPQVQQHQQPNGISSNGFYGNKPEPQRQSLPERTNGNASAGANNSSVGNIYPIEALSPYAHKWTIKARVTNKSEIKTWHNKNGEGKLFSVSFLDESGEIRGTAFNEQCDTLFDLFQEGNVYYISSPCRVVPAKKQFSNVNNDYELTFERDTMVEKAEDQQGVPKVQYNFTNIGDLQTVEKDTTIDTIAILKEVGDVSQITSKTTSKPYDKRELTLVDDTGFSVRLTIWGNTATTFEAPLESVIAFKGVKVSDFGGRSLSLLSAGSLSIDPDIDDAHKLKGWYDAQGRQDSFQSHAAVMGTVAGGGRKEEYKTIQAVRDEGLGMSENTDYFTLKATVVYVKQENIAYPACSTEGCNKKVVEVDPGQWRCEKCDKTYPRPDYRYILSVNVSDHTGQIWLSCFDDVGRLILGSGANELVELKDNDEKAFGEKVTDANCRTWVFRCRAKMDTFQDTQRVRYQVSTAHPLNYTAECAKLAEILKQYSLASNDSLFVQ